MLLLFGNTNAGVGYLKTQIGLIVLCRCEGTQYHLATIRKLDSVGHQIYQDLPETGGIADNSFRKKRIDIADEFKPFLMGGDRQRFHGVAEFQLHVEFDGLEIYAISFDLR